MRTNLTRTFVLGSLVLASCIQRRSYPLVAFDISPVDRPWLDASAAARLDDGSLVLIEETDSGNVYENRPPVPGESATSGGWLEPLEVLTLSSSASACAELEGRSARRCRDRAYRALATLVPAPIRWIGGDGDAAAPPPHHITDLALFLQEDDATVGLPPRLLGVTEFSTIGRVTGYREDKVAHGRHETERLFVLERRDDHWQEVFDPTVDALRQHLSDWGRASCGDDMVIEGLAFDPEARQVYFGLRRCEGPSQRVLTYPLGIAERGGVAVIEELADGVRDAQGTSIAGPSEGISSLDWAQGRLWASTAWEDYGYDDERAWGGRILTLDDGALHPITLPGPLVDRPGALVVLPRPDAPTQGAAEPDVNMLVLFDNDRAGRDSGRPQATLLHARTPAPRDGAPIELLALEPSPLGDRPLGLNGFDVIWFARDHRLGQLAFTLDEQAGEPGAWTKALGGLWQVRLGFLARGSRAVLGKKLGHSRQAVELTDYGPASELSFHSYRAVLSVTPTERTGAEASTAALLEGLRGAHSLEVELPRGYPDGAGLVLQSVTIDTSPRAAGGICLSGMDLGVDWAEHPLDDAQVATITDASGRRSISLRASLLGGLCNDFNVQLPEEYHGLTTDPEAGVRVTIGFAVVQGGEARHATVTAAQRDRPGVRAKGSDPASIAQGSSPPPPPAYAHATAPYRIDNDGSKDNLGCVQIGPGEDEAELLPKPSTRLGPTDAESAWMVESDGSIPEQGRSGQATSLRGFTLATDLRGFDPSLASDAYRDVTELTARSQNNYIYRYLLRTWLQPDGSVFLEGGLAHGIHTSGPGKDNALPSAVLVSADLAWWEGLSAPPIAYGAAPPQRARDDANLQPEDGFLRWAFTQPRDQEEVTCYSR